MEFWIVTAVLFLISFLWALASLKREHTKPHEVEHARRELTREKILFQKN